MSDGLDLIPAADPRWDDVLQDFPHDFYHRRAYHRLAELNGEGDAVLAVYRQGSRAIAWPALVRRIPGTDLRDIGCVYGYAGPVRSSGTGDDERDGFMLEAWQGISSAWVDSGIVSVFTTFNPLLGNDLFARDWFGDPLGPTPVEVLGRTAMVDLSATRSERRSGYEKETRYEVVRAERLGVTMAIDRDGEHLGDLVRLYHETMQRNAADGRHRFSASYFENLWHALEGQARLVVASFDGTVIGVLLVVVRDAFAHAHLTGVSAAHLRLAPLNAMIDAAADLARTEGALELNLGAGREGREDSLFTFKCRIGVPRGRFVVGRWVLRPHEYAALTSTAGPGGDPGYFPAYRASTSGGDGTESGPDQGESTT